MSEWIDVKQGMPPNRKPVLVYAKGLQAPDGIRMAAYDEAQPASMYWHGIIMGHGRGVTHWMPLPEPPAVPITERKKA